MRTLISTSEIVAEVSSSSGPAEVHVSAEGTFDTERSEVTVTLDSELRTCTSGSPIPRPAWLPSLQVVKEHVDAEEATLFARDVFHHWAEQVRHAVPSEIIHSGLPPG
ncbi:hypothetical protein ACXR0O_12185 [Verrucomicrobiota bacterium sgz303538]